MTAGMTLQAIQINHGQSEIWLETEGRELTARRTLATNEVINVARRHCPAEVFEAFYKDYYRTVGHTSSLPVSTLDELVTELKLNA